jgi:mono/diheme cytochrome c family protein
MKIKIIFFAAVLTVFYCSACLNDDQIEFRRYYTAGALIYQTRCQNCHGADGEGLSSLIPPLTDTSFLRKNIRNLSCYLKNGMNQPLLINQKPYQGKMPASNLAPIELARVLTYVGNSFGNKLKTIPIEQTTADLKGCN